MDQSYQSIPTSQIPPKNWLVEAILVTIFCCLPLGIVAIVFAAQVNTKFAQGDYEGALIASKEAGRWTKISFFVSLALGILSIVYSLLFGGWAIMQSGIFNR